MNQKVNITSSLDKPILSTSPRHAGQNDHNSWHYGRANSGQPLGGDMNGSKGGNASSPLSSIRSVGALVDTPMDRHTTADKIDLLAQLYRQNEDGP